MRFRIWHKLLVLVFLWAFIYFSFIMSSKPFNLLETHIGLMKLSSTAMYIMMRNATDDDGKNAMPATQQFSAIKEHVSSAEDLIVPSSESESIGNSTMKRNRDHHPESNIESTHTTIANTVANFSSNLSTHGSEFAYNSTSNATNLDSFDIYYQHLESQEDINWCKRLAVKNKIVVGKSWGRTSKAERKKYNEMSCDSIVALGSQATCDERFGWGLPFLWLRGRSPSNTTARDAYECVTSATANVMCRMTASMDHSLYKTVVPNPSKDIASREFLSGFLQTYGRLPAKGPDKLVWTGHLNNPHPYPHNITSGGDLTIRHKTFSQRSYSLDRACDYWEMRPTFVLAPDLQTNVGHYMNDLMNLWSAMILAGRTGQESLLLHMEGLRKLTPGSVIPHRIYDKTKEDYIGPFEAYVLSWFSEVVKPSTYNKAKVCYKELYMPYMPGLPWIWGDFELDNKCSIIAPSPLYQSFNLFLRERWRAAYGQASLPDPQTDLVHVVLEFRSTAKNALSIVRLVLNKEEIADRIRAEVPGVNVTVVDLGTISHKEQVALVHSAGVFVSMHGGGAFQIFNAAVGTPHCCAMLELFPDKNAEGDFPGIRTIGNIARHMGIHYARYDPPVGSTTNKGTTLNATHVVSYIRDAVEKVRSGPARMHHSTSRTDIDFMLERMFDDFPEVKTLHHAPQM